MGVARKLIGQVAQTLQGQLHPAMICFNKAAIDQKHDVFFRTTVKPHTLSPSAAMLQFSKLVCTRSDIKSPERRPTTRRSSLAEKHETSPGRSIAATVGRPSATCQISSQRAPCGTTASSLSSPRKAKNSAD